jgi:hypothetical protein
LDYHQETMRSAVTSVAEPTTAVQRTARDRRRPGGVLLAVVV